MALSLDPPPKSRNKVVVAAIAAILLVVFGSYYAFGRSDGLDTTKVCVLPPVVEPYPDFRSSEYFFSDEFINRTLHVFPEAIRVPTVSYDDMDLDPSKDERFHVFAKLHALFRKEFPLLSKHSETVNKYALLYTIPGTDKSLQPALLMSHQDVVPVNSDTIGQWDHDPFGGVYDGEWIYGRGSVDTKNSMIAQLEALENLLEQGWKPKRTVLYSLGFDEEIGGPRGAKHVADLLLSRYGNDSISFVLDEGSMVEEMYGGHFAMPSVAEKGRIDFRCVLDVPGGHSSMPPDHTGIGIIADLVASVENDPFKSTLRKDSALVSQYECIGVHAKHMDKSLRKTLLNLGNKRNLQKLQQLIEEDPIKWATLSTTTAVDRISGGSKINQLPEEVVLEIDHRVSTDSSVHHVKEHMIRHARAIAQKYDLGCVIDDERVSSGKYGILNITSFSTLEPAPISPYGDDVDVWNILAGVNRYIYEGWHGVESIATLPEVIVGNTDTCHFWPLSRQIYRYIPILESETRNLHTVNEKIKLTAHLTAVAWYYEFILHTTR